MSSFKIRFRIYDLLFYFLLVFSFYFTRNNICRIMMVVFFGYTIWQQIVQKRKPVGSFFYVGFMLFVLYGFVNVLIGNVISTKYAQLMTVSLFLSFLMIYAIVQYIDMADDISRVLRVTEFGIFTAALVVVMLSLGTITQGRLGKGTEMNANMLAMLCVYGLILSVYLHKQRKIIFSTLLFRVAFYVFVVLLTGSRKGVIMIALATMIILFVAKKGNIVKNVLIVAAISIAGYILVMNVEFLYNIIGARIENLLILLSGGQTTEGSLNNRQQLVEIGLAYIKQKPWTGYGYDCYKLISGFSVGGAVGAGEIGYYSHNNYIELLFGGGIIGFVLYYTPIMYLLKKLLKELRANVAMPYLLAILVSKLSVEYAYVSCFERMDAYIVAIILGCVLISSKRRDEQLMTSI